MKNKLQEIKDMYCAYDENYCLDAEQVEWLMEQAEKVEQYEKALKVTERLNELINRRPNRWGHLTVKEFERDIKILQEACKHLVIRDEYVNRIIKLFYK